MAENTGRGYIDREQALQLKRAGTYGYRWADAHRSELEGLTLRADVYDRLIFSDSFNKGLPKPFGASYPAKLAQFGRVFKAAVWGVVRYLNKQGVNLAG